MLEETQNEDQSKIHYICIINLDTEEPITQVLSARQSEEDFYTKTITNVVQKLKVINLISDERHTEHLSRVKILSAADHSVKFLYSCIVTSSYPEQIGYKLLDELKANYSKILNTDFLDPRGSNRLLAGIQLKMVELREKYENSSNPMVLVHRDLVRERDGTERLIYNSNVYLEVKDYNPTGIYRESLYRMKETIKGKKYAVVLLIVILILILLWIIW